MKVESYLLVGIGAFFGLLCVAYWFLSYENAGTVMLFLSGGLGLLPGCYLYYWSRRMRPRVEDRDDAAMADGSGVVGVFPGSSIWPFVLGGGAFFTCAGLIFGFWLTLMGLCLIFSSMVGGITESRRGGTV